MNVYYKHFNVLISCCRKSYENLINLYIDFYELFDCPAMLNSVLSEYAYYTNY